jgi:hypothetical protein
VKIYTWKKGDGINVIHVLHTISKFAIKRKKKKTIYD